MPQEAEVCGSHPLKQFLMHGFDGSLPVPCPTPNVQRPNGTTKRHNGSLTDLNEVKMTPPRILVPPCGVPQGASDVMTVSQDAGAFTLRAFKNNYFNDAFFLKAAGVCGQTPSPLQRLVATCPPLPATHTHPRACPLLVARHQRPGTRGEGRTGAAAPSHFHFSSPHGSDLSPVLFRGVFVLQRKPNDRLW